MIYKKDYLPNINIPIYQRNDMYHFNSDTSLLGSFIKIERKDRVLDIGCNNGALMLYASMYHPKDLVGVDIFKEVTDLAKMNLLINDSKGNVITKKIQEYEDNQFDVIISNPPYFQTGKESLKNLNPYLKAARHEDTLSMHELFTCVNRLLKEDGRFYYVHRPEELKRIQIELSKVKLYIKRIQVVYDKKTNKERTILLEITKSFVDDPKFLASITL